VTGSPFGETQRQCQDGAMLEYSTWVPNIEVHDGKNLGVNLLMVGNIGYSISKWLVSQRKRKRYDGCVRV